MKNYWLIASGFALGAGVQLLIDSKRNWEINKDKASKDQKEGVYYLVAGALLAFVAIKYIDKK